MKNDNEQGGIEYEKSEQIDKVELKKHTVRPRALWKVWLFLENIHGLGERQPVHWLDHITNHHVLDTDFKRFRVDLDHGTEIIQPHVALGDVTTVLDRLNTFFQTVLLTTFEIHSGLTHKDDRVGRGCGTDGSKHGSEHNRLR